MDFLQILIFRQDSGNDDDRWISMLGRDEEGFFIPATFFSFLQLSSGDDSRARNDLCCRCAQSKRS